MNILGIDPSLTSTGWCVIKHGVITKYGSIKPELKWPIIKRIRFIVNEISKIDWDRSDYLFIESGAMNATGQIVQLAELSGAIKNALYQTGTRVFSFTPTQARKIVLGHGNIPFDKKQQLEQYIDHVRKHLKEDLDELYYSYVDADRYDACIIAKAGQLELSSPESNQSLMLMRLHDEKILVKNNKGVYTTGTGKKKIQFKNLNKVDPKVVNDLVERYREVLGLSKRK